MNETKLMKAAKSWDTIAKVCKGVFSAAWIVGLIFAALLLLFGEKMYSAADSFTLDLDFVKLHLAEGYHASGKVITVYFITSLIAAAGICFAVSCGIDQLRGILSPMKEGRPFEKDTPRKLRNIAWIILAGGFVSELSSTFRYFALTRIYPIDQIFSDAVEKIEYTVVFDFGFVLIACAVLFLSYIFAYGQKLQQESDETL